MLAEAAMKAKALKAANQQANNDEIQKMAEDKVKNTIVPTVTYKEQKMDLSSGIGLALLSKALGVKNIEDKYMKHINNIRKTRLIMRMEMRLRVQKKIRQDVSRLTHKTDLDVSKMYWRSKKNVYGIDNELHLVE
jgi:hypothetical protein